MAIGESWRIGPYRALTHLFVVEGVASEPVLRRLVHDLEPLAVDRDGGRDLGAASPAGPDSDRLATYRVEPMADGTFNGYRVRFGREVIAEDQSPFHAAGLVLWHVNQQAVAKDAGEHLILHAAGAELQGVLVLILGVSGAGKTTTVAGLLRAGYRYLTDEAVVLDRATLRTTSFPKALALNADVVPLVGSGTSSAQTGLPERVRHDRWWDLGSPGIVASKRPGLIVVLRPPDDPATPVGTVWPISSSETALELAKSTFSFSEDPTGYLVPIAELASECPGYAMVTGDIDAAVSSIDSLVAAIAGGQPGAPSRPQWAHAQPTDEEFR